MTIKAINLTKELKNKKIIFGSKTAVKQIKKGAVKAVYIAVDFPSPKVQSIKAKAKAAKSGKSVEITQLDVTAEQMQEICKKPFSISVISVLKKESEKTEKKEEKQKLKQKLKKEKPMPKAKRQAKKQEKKKAPSNQKKSAKKTSAEKKTKEKKERETKKKKSVKSN